MKTMIMSHGTRKKTVILPCVLALLLAGGALSAQQGVDNTTDISDTPKKKGEVPVPRMDARKKAPAEKEKKAKEEEKEKKREENEKQKVEWIEKTMQFGVQKDRKEAITLILGVKNREMKSRLEEKLVLLLKDETDMEVKVKAITVAGELKLRMAVPWILKYLDDPAEDVKIACVHALKSIKDASSKGPLVVKFKGIDLTKNSNLTDAYLTALAEFKASELREYAVSAINDGKTDKTIRVLLVLFLGRVGAVESKDLLVKMMKDPEEDREARAYAANALGNLGIKEAAKDIDEVIQTIESYPFSKKKDYYNLYMYCVAALAKLGDDRALPRLNQSLRSDSSAVRLRAVKLLRELKDKRTIDILKYKMQYDPNSKVQKEAEEALKDLGVDTEKDKPPVSEKRKALKGKNETEDAALEDRDDLDGAAVDKGAVKKKNSRKAR